MLVTRLSPSTRGTRGWKLASLRRRTARGGPRGKYADKRGCISVYINQYMYIYLYIYIYVCIEMGMAIELCLCMGDMFVQCTCGVWRRRTTLTGRSCV